MDDEQITAKIAAFRKSKIPRRPPARGALPALIINKGDPTATAKELAALFAAREDFLFNGYAPVQIVVEGDDLPRAIVVTTEALRVYAHSLCRPVKIRHGKRGEPTPAPLSNDIARLYLHGLEGQWGLRSFRGITTAPILKDNGSIRTVAGFDRETELWCHNIPALEISDRPTEADARAALRRLRVFFQTFPYADGERKFDSKLAVAITDLDKPIGLDESTFLAALLTAVCRQSLELAPGIMVRAPTFSGAGTGKGLAVKAVCIIASGARPAAFTSGHDVEEFDKRLTAALIEARPAVFLDNFNAKELKSDVLDSALTEYPAMVRPMGQTKMVPLHTRTQIAITGNAIEIAEDMARRILSINFDAQMEDPELRKFAPGFLEQVFSSRSRLLADALTIWRWGRQNSLKPGTPLGSYEIWAQWCRDPLLALGCPDPLNRLAAIKAADPRRRLLIALFDTWRDTHGDAALKASQLADAVTSLMSDQSRKYDGPPSRQIIASFLSKNAGTRIGGYWLEQRSGRKVSRPTAEYTLHYTPPKENAE
jgi:hypothetical protein